MDLFCPHCTRRVTVPDEQAGQVLSCPLCSKQFMAPSLPQTSTAPKPAAPPPVPAPPKSEETYGLGAAPVPPPSPQPAAAPQPPSSVPEPGPAVPPAPPPPPGDFTRSCTCSLSDSWLAFVTPACVFVIFLLSFFTWHTTETTTAANLWGLAFSQQSGHFIGYAILMILVFPLTIVAMVFDKGWIVAPPPLALVMTFKNLVVAILLAIAFVLLCYAYLDGNILQPKVNPIAVPMKLAFRLHFLALLASFLMFWLHWRKQYNLPLPKIEMRW